MIISYRALPDTFGTDSVARSVRALWTPARTGIVGAPRENAPATVTRDDFARLYPALFAEPQTLSLRARAVRAAASITAAGSAAAALVALLHK